MIEIALLVIAAILLSRTKLWQKPEPKPTDICWGSLLASFFDSGPLRTRPLRTVKEDPNSNPHYIWSEQDQDR